MYQPHGQTLQRFLLPFRSILAVAWMVLCCCGSGGAVPDGADAQPDAVPCDCPVLTPDDIHRNSYSRAISGGLVTGCPDGESLILGSCIIDTLDTNKPLIDTGFDWLDAQKWSCRWRSTGPLYPYTITTVCLLPESSGVQCTCGATSNREPVANRLIATEQGGVLAPTTFSTVSSACQQGVLLGGSCIVERLDTTGAINNTSLASAGPTADERWACTWNNPTDVTLTATATAVCLLPDPAETTPLADRIVRVERAAQLPANNLHLEDVACDAGDFLLWGSCALDNPDPTLSDVFLFRSGFVDPGSSNTWQCGWYNPTALTPAVTTTAVCLRP